MFEVHILAQADITLACSGFNLFGMTFAKKRKEIFENITNGTILSKNIIEH